MGERKLPVHKSLPVFHQGKIAMPDDVHTRALKIELIERILRLDATHVELLRKYLDLLDPPELVVQTSKCLGNSGVEEAGDGLQEKAAPPQGDSGNWVYRTPNFRDWPHAPVHRLSETGTFIVTGSTIGKHHFFNSASRLDLLESSLLAYAKSYGWNLEAWAVFSNHYHFVAHATDGCKPLGTMLKELHRTTSRELNSQDNELGRQVWFNFWDTRFTFENSYFARLKYVHFNAVKHGLVLSPSLYRWCSAAMV